jgi:streptogramin lyase
MSASAESRVGTELLGYRIEALLGRGGMSLVYRAHDPRLKRDVALKVLAHEVAEDSAFRERFLSESELAAGLEHPNVVPIHDVGEVDGQLFIVMRLVEEGDLRSLLEQAEKLDARRTLALVRQVAEALDAAHERGLVHRDVKPSNVLVDGNRHAYLTDFGLSRRLSDQAIGFDAGLSLGTPAYVAPEQIRGNQVDGRADQYSLGCLLYECLTGEPPFPRSTEAAVLFAHLEEAPPAPRELGSVLPRALAKDPADRFGSCTELVDAVADALGIRVHRRSPWPLAVAAVGAALIAASSAVFLTRGGPASTGLGGRLLRIDPVSDRVTAATPVGDGASAVAVGSGRVWVGSYRSGTLADFDPRTGETTKPTAFGQPYDVTVHAGKAYVAAFSATQFGGSVSQYDAITGGRMGGVDVFLPCSLTSGVYGVWVADCPSVYELDIDGGNVTERARVAVPLAAHLSAGTYREALGAMAMGYGSVWAIGDADDQRLWRIDPHRHRIVSTIRLGFPPADIAVGEGAVWVTDQLDDRVFEVDPATNRMVRSIPVGRGAGGVAVGLGGVWVAGALDHTVTRVDASTGRVLDTIPVAASPESVAVGDGAVWAVGDAR